MLNDKPQECVDLMWAKLDSLKETQIEARMRLDGVWANIQHSRRRKTASEFEPVFVKIIRDAEKKGMAKSQQDYFLAYLRTVTNQEKAEIMRDRRMRVDRENPGTETMRVSDSWEEAQQLLKEQEVVVSSTRALDGKWTERNHRTYNVATGGYDPKPKPKKKEDTSTHAQIAALVQTTINSMKGKGGKGDKGKGKGKSKTWEPPPYPRDICYGFAKEGKCEKGDSCNYSHDAKAVAAYRKFKGLPAGSVNAFFPRTGGGGKGRGKGRSQSRGRSVQSRGRSDSRGRDDSRGSGNRRKGKGGRKGKSRSRSPTPNRTKRRSQSPAGKKHILCRYVKDGKLCP
jgi:hypothetical protein